MVQPTDNKGKFKNEHVVILLGNANVGKTHLLLRFAKKRLPSMPMPTVGVEFEPIKVKLANDEEVKLTIWDTAGQEKFRSVIKSHYRRAVGCFLVFDLTNRDSFMDIPTWLSDLHMTAPPDIVIILIGNKLDLLETGTKREVSREEAESYAKQNGMMYFETSAASLANVSDALSKMAETLHERHVITNTITQNSTNGNAHVMRSANGGLSFSDAKEHSIVCCGLRINYER